MGNDATIDRAAATSIRIAHARIHTYIHTRTSHHIRVCTSSQVVDFLLDAAEGEVDVEAMDDCVDSQEEEGQGGGRGGCDVNGINDGDDGRYSSDDPTPTPTPAINSPSTTSPCSRDKKLDKMNRQREAYRTHRRTAALLRAVEEDKANIYVYNSRGFNLLHIACMRGDAEVAERLIRFQVCGHTLVCVCVCV